MKSLMCALFSIGFSNEHLNPVFQTIDQYLDSTHIHFTMTSSENQDYGKLNYNYLPVLLNQYLII